MPTYDSGTYDSGLYDGLVTLSGGAALGILSATGSVQNRGPSILSGTAFLSALAGAGLVVNYGSSTPVLPDPATRTRVPVQTITQWGVTPAYTSVSSLGHLVENPDGRVILHVKTSGSGPSTLYIRTAVVLDRNTIADHTVVILAATEALISTIRPWLYTQPDGAVGAGSIYVDVYPPSGVLIAAVHT